MSANNNEQKDKDKELQTFLERQINIINEYSEGEEVFDKKLREKHNTNIANYQIYILNKEWIEK